MFNSNDHLIKHINLKLNTSEKCPLCNNTIRIDVRDEAQYNKLMGALKKGYREYEKRAIRFSQFKNIRFSFWFNFITLAVYTSFAFLKVNLFYSLALLSICWGIFYIILYILQTMTERKIENKRLQDEIDELIG